MSTMRVATEGLGVAVAHWGNDADPAETRPVCLEVPEPVRGLWISEERDAQAAAKALCEDCPRRQRCLRLALDSKANAGIYGAYDLGSARDRRAALEWIGDVPRRDKRPLGARREAVSRAV